MRWSFVLMALLMLSRNTDAQTVPEDGESIVKCTDTSIRREYSGPRYPKDTGWKVPYQILSGYAVGLLSAGFAYQYYGRPTSVDTLGGGGGFGVIAAAMSFFIIGLPVFTVTNPIPVWAIGNYGNEKSSLGLTYLGSAGGMLIPFIGGPIGATILNRSSRTYEYYCIENIEDADKSSFDFRFLTPDIQMDNGQIKYRVQLVSISL